MAKCEIVNSKDAFLYNTPLSLKYVEWFKCFFEGSFRDNYPRLFDRVCRAIITLDFVSVVFNSIKEKVTKVFQFLQGLMNLKKVFYS